MLAFAAGWLGNRPPVNAVMRVLSDAGVFRFGGVLVGTGVHVPSQPSGRCRFEQQTMLADIDVAQDDSILWGFGCRKKRDVIAFARRSRARRDPRLRCGRRIHIVPGKTRLRVDFLIPEAG